MWKNIKLEFSLFSGFIRKDNFFFQLQKWASTHVIAISLLRQTQEFKNAQPIWSTRERGKIGSKQS